MEKTSFVSTPKTFFVKERDQFYSDWKLAFWREFFQNSIDAGAKVIDVTVEDASRRGSFGRLAADASPLTRVVFADDGCGMTKSVLDEVYFSVGRSTKTDDSTVGGFGRARLMTCFSQTRYSVHTLDNVVEGDGGEFVNATRDEAVLATGRWAAVAEAALEASDPSPAARRAIADIRASGIDPLGLASMDRSRLSDEESGRLIAAEDAIRVLADHGTSLPLVGEALRLRREAERVESSPATLKGCRIEVDLDTTQDSYRRATTANMLGTLRTYLDQSDVKCEVRINGSRYERPAYKLEGRRNLVATLPDHDVPDSWRSQSSKVKATRRPDGEWDVVFGRIMTGSGDGIPGSCKGQITVRVDGASMFDQSSGGTNAAVFVEILPSLAREVLTSNRDGLKTAYKRALDDLTALLSTDSQAALRKDQQDLFTVLRGGKGAKRGFAKSPEGSVDYAARIDPSAIVGRAQVALADRIRDSSRSVYFSNWSWDEFVEGKMEGLDRNDVVAFLDDAAKRTSIEGTFLESYRDRNAAESMLVTLRNRGPKAALEFASGELLGYVADNLSLARLIAEERVSKDNEDKLRDLNDVAILRENMSPPPDKYTEAEARTRRSRIVAGARRHDPRNWDVTTGKGMQPRKVLAAWNVAIDHCVDALFEKYPDTPAFDYSCGWLFTHPQWSYDSAKRAEGWRETRAMARIEKSGVKSVAFLLNPLESKDDFRSAFSPSDSEDRDRIITVAAHEVAHVVAPSHNDAYAYVFTDIVEALTTKRRRTIHSEIDRACKVIDRLYAEGKTRIVPMDDEPGVRPAARLMQGIAAEIEHEAVVGNATSTTYDNDVLDARETEMLAAQREPEYGLSGP